MSVNKVKEVNINTEIESGDGHIEIKLTEQHAPALIDTYWCDEILIWWDCNTCEVNDSVRVYSLENFEEHETDYQLVNQYKEPNLMEAILYTFNKLI